MKRQALVSLGLWLIYAVAWYIMLWMNAPMAVLIVMAVIPSFPMSKWFWDSYGDVHFGSRWSLAWIWILRWGFGMLFASLLGLLLCGVLEPFNLATYSVPLVYLTFILMQLYVEWGFQMDMRSYKSS